MAEQARRVRTSRIGEETWIEAALDMLADGGPAAVRVEPLALRLGVTKGAFYARYPTRDALLNAMLDYWRRVSTVDVFEAFSAIDETPEQRLDRILRLSTRRPDVHDRGRLEMGIRIWAHHDARAAATMEEIDAYRLGYFQAVLRANGFDEREAEARALLVYGYTIADGCISGHRSEPTKAFIRRLLSADKVNEGADG